jgi:hypothetical protein
MGTVLLLSKSSATFWLHTSEAVLVVSGVLLFAGLIGEKKVPWWHSRFRTFELLVIIGVAGELLGDGGVFVFSGDLQTIADTELARVTTDLGDTRTAANNAADAAKGAMGSAQLANDQAGIARQHAGEIGKQASLLRRQTEKLTQENLAMESRLEKAGQELEAEKRKRVELAASMLDREFFDQSGAAVRLVPFPPMSVIFEYVDEHEPKNMAEQINFIFKSLLHWSTWRRSVNEETIEDGVSISVGMEPPSSFPPGTPEEERFKSVRPEYQQKRLVGQVAAQALRDGIGRCGIDVEIGNDAYGLPPTTLLIIVGRKPNHALEETLRELGPHPNPTVVGQGMLGGNRDPIPQQKPDAGKNRPQ